MIYAYSSRLFTIPAVPYDGGWWTSKCDENGLQPTKALIFPLFFFFSPFIGKDANHSRLHTPFFIRVFLHFAFIFRLFSFSSFFLFVCLTVCVYISDMFAFIRTNNDVIHLFSQQPTSSSSTGSSYTFPRHLRRYCFLFMVIKVTRETIVKSEVKKEEKKRKEKTIRDLRKVFCSNYWHTVFALLRLSLPLAHTYPTTRRPITIVLRYDFVPPLPSTIVLRL